jgi:hypothetical protein
MCQHFAGHRPEGNRCKAGKIDSVKGAVPELHRRPKAVLAGNGPAHDALKELQHAFSIETFFHGGLNIMKLGDAVPQTSWDFSL